MAAVKFSLGECFNSYDEFEKKLESYEASTSTKYWRRDSRTVEAARKRVNRPIADKLKYYELLYRCIHGGRKFKARGDGKRATS